VLAELEYDDHEITRLLADGVVGASRVSREDGEGGLR
jgi:hypothetical protein